MFVDFLKYLSTFENYLSKRIYIIFFLNFFVSVSDIFAILMIFPLLDVLLNLSENIENQSDLNPTVTFFISVFNYLNIDFNAVNLLAFLIIIFTVKGIFLFGALSYTATFRGKLLGVLKEKLLSKYIIMDYQYYLSNDSGHFINIINEQINRAIISFQSFAQLVGHLISTIIYLLAAIYIARLFGVTALILAFFLILIFKLLNHYVARISIQVVKENKKLTSDLIEFMRSFKYLKSTGTINKISKKIFASISNLSKYNIKQGIALSITQSSREPLVIFLVIIIIIINIFFLEGEISSLLASLVLFYRAQNSVLQSQIYWQNTLEYGASLNAVVEEFKQQDLHKQLDNEGISIDLNKKIEFKDVSFVFQKENKIILENLNFSINAFETFAIVGKSGSGKSTILDLIVGLLKPSKGEILFDSVESKNINLDYLRKKVGFVTQESILFDSDIESNISLKFSEKNSDVKKDVIKAATLANIHEFIISLEHGYKTEIGENGVLLSGGQRQRLIIARELFKKPEILIFDEATSALDSESERKIHETLESLNGKLTLVIVTHKLSNLENIKNIILIDEGRIIESGSYNDLINNKNSKFNLFLKYQNSQ